MPVDKTDKYLCVRDGHDYKQDLRTLIPAQYNLEICAKWMVCNPHSPQTTGM